MFSYIYFMCVNVYETRIHFKNTDFFNIIYILFIFFFRFSLIQYSFFLLNDTIKRLLNNNVSNKNDFQQFFFYKKSTRATIQIHEFLFTPNNIQIFSSVSKKKTATTAAMRIEFIEWIWNNHTVDYPIRYHRQFSKFEKHFHSIKCGI